ncbi:hypothetical protein ACFY7C_21320 [Streptomyces sp. NPDC012769]|uniref:hypothetical protein n=1 Tax=Streptomyces sp. NPDC012769 TaxID=3364848 RepID=UPI00367A9276
MTTTGQKSNGPPDPSTGTHPAHCGCVPSAELLGRARRGWEAFLARTGPLPGEPASDTDGGR